MNNPRSLLLRVVFVCIITLPLFAYSWFSARYSYLQQLTEMYQCEKDVCEADFDGDGVLGRVVIERTNNSASADASRLVVTDGGQEILRLPYAYLDNTFRTHIAVIKGTGNKSQLLIFDGTRGRQDVTKAVYEWQSGNMIRTSAVPIEMEILTAMAAHDDAGKWLWWSLFRAFSVSLLLGYYIVLACIIVGFIVRHRIRLSVDRPN
ncbi:MAG: hypothetical protein MSG64_17990 [Pyrinomonadaceae bacterium MAG19_C2-C3]|nr:hypothetical protein [Pyrinomonadaceae bacterium MAG19_C2-C3]